MNDIVQVLLAQGHRVHVLDNLCRGSLRNIAEFQTNVQFSFHEIDLSVQAEVTSLFLQLSASEPVDEVWHLAANSDIPAGIAD